MNPIRAGAVEELRKVSRNVFCKHYDGCLDLTLQRGWKSFSCRSCADFNLIQKSPLDWEEDALRCGALAGVVFGFVIMPETGF